MVRNGSRATDGAWWDKRMYMRSTERQPVECTGFGQRQRTSDDGDPRYSLRQRLTERCRVLPAKRPTHHREPVGFQPVKQFGGVSDPVEDGSARLRIRAADSR